MVALKNPLRALLKALPLFGSKRALVSVIELSGVIGDAGPGRKGLSYGRVESAVEAAFKPGALKAVALVVNSPGGSPVQSRMIYAAVRREAAKKRVPVFAFVEDVGASGGYILALAADEIYADASSIVGSIGVISAGFGFQEAIARLGVERRVYTAGASKSQLDPFRAEKPEDIERLKTILDDLHRQFVDLVKERRASKLSAHDDIFTGAFWTAGEAEKRGLIDGSAHLADFMRARFGDDVKLKKVEPRQPSLIKKVFGGESRATTDPDALIAAFEARALWARYGL